MLLCRNISENTKPLVLLKIIYFSYQQSFIMIYVKMVINTNVPYSGIYVLSRFGGKPQNVMSDHTYDRST